MFETHKKWKFLTVYSTATSCALEPQKLINSILHDFCYLHKYYFHLLLYTFAKMSEVIPGGPKPFPKWSQKYPERVVKTLY